MFTVEFNLADIERLTKQVGGAADQIPFVMSQLLNDGAFKARQVLVSQTWPRSVTARNASFIAAALRINKSTKGNLRVEVTDVLNRAHLQLHAKGGVKQARRRLAIPVPGSVRYGAHGIRERDRPKALIARTSARALRITQRGIFVGQGGRLHLKYSFKPAATQPKDVPFYEDFAFVMRAAVRTGFADAMRRAMRTRR